MRSVSRSRSISTLLRRTRRAITATSSTAYTAAPWAGRGGGAPPLPRSVGRGAAGLRRCSVCGDSVGSPSLLDAFFFRFRSALNEGSSTRSASEANMPRERIHCPTNRRSCPLIMQFALSMLFGLLVAALVLHATKAVVSLRWANRFRVMPRRSAPGPRARVPSNTCRFAPPPAPYMRLTRARPAPCAGPW